MASSAELWSTIKSYWEPAKALYKNISGLASLIALPSVSKYLYDRWKKKRQMPELACNIILEDNTIIPQGKPMAVGRGYKFVSNGTSKLQQICKLNISNVSEFIALKLTVKNKEAIDFEFPLDSTKVLKGYENIILTLIPFIIDSNDTVESIHIEKSILINEIIIEYRNTSGKKYQLTFKPNENDIDKRNVCKRV